MMAYRSANPGALEMKLLYIFLILLSRHNKLDNTTRRSASKENQRIILKQEQQNVKGNPWRRIDHTRNCVFRHSQTRLHKIAKNVRAAPSQLKTHTADLRYPPPQDNKANQGLWQLHQQQQQHSHQKHIPNNNEETYTYLHAYAHTILHTTIYNI